MRTAIGTGRAGLALLLGLTAGSALAADPFLRRTAAVHAVEKSGPAVVNITTERLVRQSNPFRSLQRDPFFDRFFRDFFEPRSARTVVNLGSGVIIDRRGRVLTNEHVVSRGSRVRVTLADGREFDAELVGADPNSDVAVLQIQLEEGDGRLPWIEPGSSKDLMVGEPVIAIGNPFGLSNTVTTGVISAVNRSVRSEERVFHGFIQTDASINPGNSGGPLLNAEGELVGINTAIYGGAEGIGFAIPIDVARRVVAELIEHGAVEPVWLGLDFQDLEPALLEALDLPPRTSGALVNRVRAPSPASRGGMRRGDVVTHVDRNAVDGARSFFEILRTATDGQQLSLDVWREGRSMRLSLRAEEVPSRHIDELVRELLGLEMELHPRGGYLIREVRSGSYAHRKGFQPGDLLLGINGLLLRDPDALRRSVLDLRGRDRALLVVQRGTGRYHVTIPLV